MTRAPAASKPSRPGSLPALVTLLQHSFISSQCSLQSVPRVCQERKAERCSEVTVTRAEGSFAPDPRGAGLISPPALFQQFTALISSSHVLFTTGSLFDRSASSMAFPRSRASDLTQERLGRRDGLRHWQHKEI